jgi:hypothetical protein
LPELLPDASLRVTIMLRRPRPNAPRRIADDGERVCLITTTTRNRTIGVPPIQVVRLLPERTAAFTIAVIVREWRKLGALQAGRFAKE